MTLTRMIRQITVWWESRQWKKDAARRRKQIARAVPEIRELERREAECRRAHKRGAARIARARRDALHKAMGMV
jgi:hypothetical protein